MDLSQQLYTKIRPAFAKFNLADADLKIQPTQHIKFGDYQISSVIGIAKKLQENPLLLAEKIAANIDLTGIASKIDVSKPGFINIHLDPDYLSTQASIALNDPHLAVSKQTQQTIVIDYSSPNLAKEMHVGHLRSTIIGDAINRILTFLGHNVIAQNHVGDWGTQFGMLTAYLMELEKNENNDLLLADLEQFYRQAKVKFDSDPLFADKARNFVVRLQSGDKEILAIWQQFVQISMQHCQTIYDKLGVLLNKSNIKGESQYNDLLQPTVDELMAKGIAVNDDGAKVIFIDEIKQKDDQATPFIIQKKDGGFLYSTTDMACIRYRANTLKADRIIYVVDSRQSLHFKELFLTVRKAGFVPDNVELTHVAFGTMLGENGKPFKTREGTSFKLIDLLNNAIEKAKTVVREKNPNLDEDKIIEIANTVGIAAIKYADLSKNRINDYVFNLNNMLAFEGNTAPYLQYAYTRIINVIKKATDSDQNSKVATQEPIEKQLAILLLQFESILFKISDNYNINYLTSYLYDIATLASRFYEHCPILSAAEPTKSARLQLARLTAKTLKIGMQLLGINVLEVM